MNHAAIIEEELKMTDRFELERQLLDFWTITAEIDRIEAQGITDSDRAELVHLYESKFKQLWANFEIMQAAGQFECTK